VCDNGWLATKLTGNNLAASEWQFQPHVSVTDIDAHIWQFEIVVEHQFWKKMWESKQKNEESEGKSEVQNLSGSTNISGFESAKSGALRC